MKDKEKNKFKHGDEVIATFGNKEYEARIELRMNKQSPCKKEDFYLCISGRWPSLVKDWPGTIELKQ